MQMQILRVVIVEDQPNIRKDLRLILESITGVVVIAEAESVQHALAVLPATHPDLLFMDIELGDGQCFEILEQLRPVCFRLVFLTAFAEHAIRAIKYGALDYLLKPVDEQQVQAAIHRAWEMVPVSPVQWQLARDQVNGKGGGQRIALPSVGHWQVVSLDQVLYAEGTHHTVFHLADGERHSTMKSLADYEQILPAYDFIRVHQSYLVHHRYIKMYSKRGYIMLENGIQIPVSARRREAVERFLSGEFHPK